MVCADTARGDGVNETIDNQEQGEVEFFGIKLKVNNDRLATLLNSSVNDNVVVVGRRTLDLLAKADEDDDDIAVEGAAGDGAGVQDGTGGERRSPPRRIQGPRLPSRAPAGGQDLLAPAQGRMIPDAMAPQLSLVIPVYNEVASLEPLLAEIDAAVAGLQTYEVVFVDDGSTRRVVRRDGALGRPAS